jgi:PUA domain protein
MMAMAIGLDSKEHMSIYTVHGEPLFFQHFDGPFYPTLRLLHNCTSIQ